MMKWMMVWMLGACSLDQASQEVEKKLGNAELVLEIGGPKEVKDLGMILHKAKLWKSSPNDQSPGAATLIDHFILELWFDLRLDNELAFEPSKEKSKIDDATKGNDNQMRYARLSGLFMNANGDLYSPSYEIGTTFFDDPSDRVTSAGIFDYTVTRENALISDKFPIYISRTELTGPISSPSSKTEILQAHEQKKSGWENAYRYSFAGDAFVERTLFEKNKDYKIKGKLGCLVKRVQDGEYQKRSFKFADVELGATLQDGEDLVNQSADSSELGDDDVLWVEWSESYFLTGIDLKDRKLRLMRRRSAPYYAARELPGVDSSVTSVKQSGMDKLVRACNETAEAGGEFQIATISGSLGSISLNLGSQNSYCSALASSDPATTDNTSASFGGCGFSLSGIAGGTWSGSSHTGPISSLPTTLQWIDYSPIQEIDF